MKIRINDLARELEVKSKAILDVLPKVGVTEKKTHSSSIEEDEAVRVRKFFAGEAAAASAKSKESRATRDDEIKTKIDLSHISRPGDVLKAISQAVHPPAPAAPPRPAAPPPTAPKPSAPAAPQAKPAAPAATPEAATEEVGRQHRRSAQRPRRHSDALQRAELFGRHRRSGQQSARQVIAVGHDVDDHVRHRIGDD